MFKLTDEAVLDTCYLALSSGENSFSCSVIFVVVNAIISNEIDFYGIWTTKNINNFGGTAVVED